MHYNRHRYYDPLQGRYIIQDPIGLKGGLNPYAYPLNPIVNIDLLGLKDVVAVVWDSQSYPFSVGHVYLGDPAGNVITSSFPSPHGLHGLNETKDWASTLAAEGRKPSGIYKITVKDDNAFDVAAQRERKEWDWWPTKKEETNCTFEAFNALSAGGVPFSAESYTPDAFHYQMQMRSGEKGSGVTRLDKLPW
nr:RHS repeat-associated core domain-containing protein [Citrobacter freundii]